MAEIISAPPENDPLVKLFTLLIGKNQKLSLYALGKKVNIEMLGLPSRVTIHNVKEVSEKLSKVEICHGLSERHFIKLLESKKGAIFNKKGKKTAYLDKSISGQKIKGLQQFPSDGTVRSTKCYMIDPLMIQLCIRLKYHSNTAYVILRNVIQLPSTRTLRDYTNYIKAKPGTDEHNDMTVSILVLHSILFLILHSI